MHSTMNTKSGFTLVELIIVIAIMAALIGVAIPIYNDNLNESRIVRVLTHYDTAIKSIRNHLSLTAIQQARGETGGLPTSSDEWIDVIDPDGAATSPSGDPAYAATVDDAKGIVGVALSEDGSTVTVTQPKYASLTGDDEGNNLQTVINLN